MTTIRKTAVRLSWKVVPFKRLIKPTVHKVLSSRLMPGCWMRAFRLLRILAFDYGHLKSSAIMRSIDAAGKPLPWITYPAIAFLLQLDLSDKKVFEYGCGASTIFWSGLAKHVDSVEDNEAFCREIWPALPPNCHLSLEPFPEEYIHAVVRGAPYDIIVIDGHSRVRCSEVAAKYLKAGWFHHPRQFRLVPSSLREPEKRGFDRGRHGWHGADLRFRIDDLFLLPPRVQR
jgi:hypothetical protein